MRLATGGLGGQTWESLILSATPELHIGKKANGGHETAGIARLCFYSVES